MLWSLQGILISFLHLEWLRLIFGFCHLNQLLHAASYIWENQRYYIHPDTSSFNMSNLLVMSFLIFLEKCTTRQKILCSSHTYIHFLWFQSSFYLCILYLLNACSYLSRRKSRTMAIFKMELHRITEEFALPIHRYPLLTLVHRTEFGFLSGT